MARMFTEREVEAIERQRELQERAKKGGWKAAMDYSEKLSYDNDRLNERFQKAHEQAMARRRAFVERNPNAETNLRFRNQVLREQELREARAHEMDRLGKELETREYEAMQRKEGMVGQGSEAARHNKDATIEAARLQTASAKEIAGINAGSAKEIAGINKEREIELEKIKGSNALAVQEKQGKTATETARIGAEAAVDAAREKTAGELARERAEDLVRRRYLEMNEGIKYSREEQRLAMAMVNQSKRKGKPTMTYEEALEKVRSQRSEPGKARPMASYQY